MNILIVTIPESIGKGRKRIIIDDEINKDTILQVMHYSQQRIFYRYFHHCWHELNVCVP